MKSDSIIKTQVLLVSMLTGASAAGATFNGLGDLPGGKNESYATAISGDGRTVVGKSSTLVDGSTLDRAYMWTSEDGMTPLSTEPGVFTRSSRAVDVSHDGSVILGTYFDEGWNANPIAWDLPSGQVNPTVIATTGSSASTHAISADGTMIVGSRSYRKAWALDLSVPNPGSSVIASGAGSIDVSEDGDIVLIRSFVTDTPYLLDNNPSDGTRDNVYISPLPGQTKSNGFALSPDGVYVVGSSGSDAFVWSEAAGVTGLGKLDGHASSQALELDADASVIVGFSSPSNSVDPNAEAVVWTGNGIQTVSSLLSEQGVDLSGWHLTKAHGISADGSTIVGTGINPSGDTEAWIAQIPSLGWPSGQGESEVIINLAANEYGKLSEGHSTYELTLPEGEWVLDLVSPDSHADAEYYSWKSNPEFTGNVWHTKYVIFTEDGELLGGAGQHGASDSEISAFLFSEDRGTDDFTLVLDSSTTLLIGVDDTIIGDNLGGLSIRVRYVPEPSSLMMFALAGLLTVRRRNA